MYLNRTMTVKIDSAVSKKLLSFGSVAIDGCLVTGGHFMLKDGQAPILNQGTLVSFEIAAKIFDESRKSNRKTGLGVLFNNIGANCGTDVCYVGKNDPDEFVLPDEYKQILDSHDIDIDDLIVFWEKHLRNRGKKEFIKRVKKIKNIETDEEGYWLKDSSGKRFMLTRKASKDKYGTPACPLIMAAYAMEQRKKGFKSSLNFWYVDTDNFENIPNHFMIEKGYEVARMLGIDVKVMNVYFTRDKVITNF